eukprot:GSMAST32.ASY1.ANO1.306.1 assembled CDS
MVEIYKLIQDGAKAFLYAEYKVCIYFIGAFFVLVVLLWHWGDGFLSITSLVSGYLGMMVAVYSNVRTTKAAMSENPWTNSFNTAFRAGGVMGFALCGIALLYMQLCMILRLLFEVVAGFGLGGSCIALFGRVGGGIYTKAADVGADLAGKVCHGLMEDDPRNPATIADNVGDNVGDVAGMEILCGGINSVLLPLYISAGGILVCIATSFFATHIDPVRNESSVEWALKVQIGVSTIFMTLVLWPITHHFLPETDVCSVNDFSGALCNNNLAFIAVCCGLWGGCLIGFITEYYTSASYQPVQELAQSTETGMYGISLAALGMLSTLATCLSIDVYGPVCDNAGGIAEMAGCPESTRDCTDALDAAGNTTAAIGKGFAIGSAALVSLALFGAFVTSYSGKNQNVVNMLDPIVFAFLVVGAMMPYWFTAMTMKSVGEAAKEMVLEVKRQFDELDLLNTDNSNRPDYARCIAISTEASLREMVSPGILVIFTPIIVGYLFGVQAVSGLLAGSLVSSLQLAISASNTGGAWDNAKKFVEKGMVEIDIRQSDGKGSDCHKAAVVGDTVGDPLKDTSGPALNIVMKLQAIISLVFCGFFLSVNSGGGRLAHLMGTEIKG